MPRLNRAGSSGGRLPRYGVLFSRRSTNYPRDMAEIALAHGVGSDVERAYRQGDMVEKRRAMIEDWARFLFGDEQQGAGPDT